MIEFTNKCSFPVPVRNKKLPLNLVIWLIFFIALLFTFSRSFAQETKSLVFQADLFNRHYWRGFVFGDSPAFEPQVTFTSGNFGFNIWAAYTFDNSYSEIDLIPSYTTGNYKISLFDYYNPVPGGKNRFFDFTEAGNRHSGEVMISYNGKGKFPFKWFLATFVYGDRHLDTRKHMFSTYFQPSYTFSLIGAVAEISVGISPWESYYSKGFAMVHTGLTIQERIMVSEEAWVPLRFALNFNPSASQAWVIFSFGIIKENHRN